MPKFDVSPQGSSGWLKARIGHLTASRMFDAMSFDKKGNELEKRRNLKIELLSERLTDMAVEHYVTPAMQWGIEREPEAKAVYEERTGNLITNCGFACHDTIEFFGASCDGLVHDGLIEIKCPTTPTFLKWHLAGVVPEQYKPQMLAQLLVTGRTWCDFVAYDPRLPEQIQFFCKRYEPAQEELDKVEQAAMIFLQETEQLFDMLVMG